MSNMGNKPRRSTERKAPSTVFCPRCDKPFTSLYSRVDAMQLMRAHVKKAHPEFLESVQD